MGPLGFLTGVILGSAVSIAVVLVMILVIFLVVASDHPSLIEEYAPLVRAALLFAGLAAVSGVAFYGLQRHTAWRGFAQFAMWAGLAAIAYAYWPEATA
jgi:hypothetical protein